ncbi:PhzF family phenazine biosynthesis protein [Parerythrobacter lacustris]|uniref:PhzF family phenazine biosynthesis protein n=1 Tax=Parerythrobacter lacustris TaxID=2969984 RepID=A0ABT1XMU3_9SPHN|nr:PhzF family phenazine biosynthesis protein [Parerythrobacter lacustris]MCR2832958.1 PhzF family phenazine biosynthesis protein [Parerythrobacter lacustris]
MVQSSAGIEVQRVAAFADGNSGGNPAGVVLLDAWPSDAEMQSIAADVGYSETVFVVPSVDGFAVRYFAPKAEVAFCGHATIALGGVLAERFGDGRFQIQTAAGTRLKIFGDRLGRNWRAGFASARCTVGPLAPSVMSEMMDIFCLRRSDLDSRLQPTVASAGLDHSFVFVSSRDSLRQIGYAFERGLKLSREHGFTTLAFVHMEQEDRFHARNFFPVGGVYEDPATGAAAAALCGYLRECGWLAGSVIQIVQGEDMGQACTITATIPEMLLKGVAIEGTVRHIGAERA